MITVQGHFNWFWFVPFAIFTALILWFTVRSIRIVSTFTKTEGVISEQTYVPPTNDSTASRNEPRKIGVYTHMATFRAADGATYTATTKVKSNPPRFSNGDTVSIYYNPSNPADASFGTFMDLWLGSILLGFFWFIFFILWFGTLVGPAQTPLT